MDLVLHLDAIPILLHKAVLGEETALKLKENEAFFHNGPLLTILKVERVLPIENALGKVLDAPGPLVRSILFLEPLNVAVDDQVLAVLNASAGGRIDWFDFVKLLEGAEISFEDRQLYLFF